MGYYPYTPEMIQDATNLLIEGIRASNVKTLGDRLESDLWDEAGNWADEVIGDFGFDLTDSDIEGIEVGNVMKYLLMAAFTRRADIRDIAEGIA
jgi:hypothetical protein